MRKKVKNVFNIIKEKLNNWAEVLAQLLASESSTESNPIDGEMILRFLVIIGKIICSILIINVCVLELLINLIFEIFDIITQSFLFTVLWSFLVIIGLLFLIFKIAPHTAFVSSTVNEASQIYLNSTIDYVSMTNENPKNMEIRMQESQEQQEVILRNCVLYSLDDDGKANNKQEYEKVRLNGQFLLFSISLLKSDGNEIPETECAFIEVDTVGMDFIERTIKGMIVDSLSEEVDEESDTGFLGSFFSDVADNIMDLFYPGLVQGVMTNFRDLNISYSSDLRTIKMDVGENSTVYCGGTFLGISPLNNNCTLEILDEMGKPIKEEPVTSAFSIFPLHSNKVITAEIHGASSVECENDGNWVIDVKGAKNFEAEVNGSIDFVYGSKPTQYELFGRKLVLRSRQGDVNLKINPLDGREGISFDGEVSYAKLSGMDLFPSFGSWYRDQVNLIPITLISTLLSAVTLMQASRKKHGVNKDSNSEGGIGKSLAAMFRFLESKEEKKNEKQD